MAGAMILIHVDNVYLSSNRSTDTITITSTGASVGSTAFYTYSGNGNYLGLAINSSSTVPDFEIGDSFTIGDYAIQDSLYLYSVASSSIIGNPLIIGSGGISSVVVTEELDSHGGIIEHITAGSIESLQSKSVTISTAGTQTITADSGYDGLSEVIVTTTGSSATEPYIEYTMSTLGDTPYNAYSYGFKCIYSGMFSAHSSLRTVDFTNCPDLFSSATYKVLGGYAFNGCTSLTTITGANWSKITAFGSSGYCFYNCQNLVLDLDDFTRFTDTQIYLYTFYACTKLTGTALPSSVTNVGSAAFRGCTSLTLSSLPTALTTVQSSAFQNCTKLTISQLPSTLTSIGSSAFYGCTGLTISTLPTANNITIGTSAFYDCTGLTISLLPSNITSQIGTTAFRGCTGLTQMEIACTSVSSQVFYGCTGLTKVWIRSTCTTISASSANNSPFTYCSTSLQIYAEPTDKLSGWGTYFNRTGTNGGTTVTVVYNQTTKPW